MNSRRGHGPVRRNRPRYTRLWWPAVSVLGGQIRPQLPPLQLLASIRLFACFWWTLPSLSLCHLSSFLVYSPLFISIHQAGLHEQIPNEAAGAQDRSVFTKFVLSQSMRIIFSTIFIAETPISTRQFSPLSASAGSLYIY
ncbi:hypothetical protein U9M48_004923 [Paspalum notatum var. saurae]|uniref:Uncharacterized protein n=1 Tax=Paspalum notatum var. saurae TaxID=547442 RepID=A0AAQ3PU99_PASNO